jgi:hypothetical protein
VARTRTREGECRGRVRVARELVRRAGAGAGAAPRAVVVDLRGCRSDGAVRRARERRAEKPGERDTPHRGGRARSSAGARRCVVGKASSSSSSTVSAKRTISAPPPALAINLSALSR